MKVVTHVTIHVQYINMVDTKHMKDKFFNIFLATHKLSIFKIMGARLSQMA
jgi:hypothetical protein